MSSYPIDELEVKWQMPPQVSVYDVTYTNLGTFVPVPGSPYYGIGGSSVTVALTGGSAAGPVPTIEIHVMVKPTAAGQTIDWPSFEHYRTVMSGVPIFGTVSSTCTPRSTSIGQTVNNTTVTPPEVCTQVPTDDGWTKTLWGVGPGGTTQSNGTADRMYTTDIGAHRFASSLKFPMVGGSCDLGGTLPAGVTVIDASVRLTKVEHCICTGPVQRLHRITQSWSEANLLPNTGPTIDGTASAEFATPTTFADVTSAQLTADVQAFVDTPATNEGWSLRQRYNGSGDTGNVVDPAGFATREHATVGSRPALTITYLP